MVSATLLSEICARLNEARGEKHVGCEVMFGKVNIILLGDMGQLRPVQASSVFARELVDKIPPSIKETERGISALY
ncbi:hypothetical protein B0H14DRAFT_2390143 [Mycena olivaceomarginata]|nr:hypothetical protein B0H14DRAFT_2390143 [Mycena olivaceomarginata]